MALMLGLLDENRELIEEWVRPIFWQNRGHEFTNGRREVFVNAFGVAKKVWGIRVYSEEGFFREGPLSDGVREIPPGEQILFEPHSIDVAKE